jgi:hypothetical protein
MDGDRKSTEGFDKADIAMEDSAVTQSFIACHDSASMKSGADHKKVSAASPRESCNFVDFSILSKERPKVG